MNPIVLIAHNLRSTHNVGSLLRTCEGLGIEKVYLTGYTPYPQLENDDRLPYLATKIAKDIHKTALGAEDMQPWDHSSDIYKLIDDLKIKGYKVYALEQTKTAVKINEFSADGPIALIVGNEVTGVDKEILGSLDGAIEIPMLGKKESFNVAQAAAMALFWLRYQ